MNSKNNKWKERSNNLLLENRALKEEIKELKNIIESYKNDNLENEVYDIKERWEKSINDLNEKANEYNSLIRKLNILEKELYKDLEKNGIRIPLKIRIKNMFKR